FTERPGEVGEDEQMMRLAVAAERLSPELEAAAFRPERPIEQARRVALEAAREAQLLCMAAEQPCRRLPEQPLTGRVDEHERLVHVEREDRDVHRPHDALQGGGRTNGPP